eukprot:358912-Chlamydomonas_euryale.AAC.3
MKERIAGEVGQIWARPYGNLPNGAGKQCVCVVDQRSLAAVQVWASAEFVHFAWLNAYKDACLVHAKMRGRRGVSLARMLRTNIMMAIFPPHPIALLPACMAEELSCWRAWQRRYKARTHGRRGISHTCMACKLPPGTRGMHATILACMPPSWHKRDLLCCKPPFISGYQDNATCMLVHGHPCTKHACLGLWSRPVTPASASAGHRPRDMHARKCPSASGLGAFAGMNVLNLRPALPSAGLIGLDLRP